MPGFFRGDSSQHAAFEQHYGHRRGWLYLARIAGFDGRIVNVDVLTYAGNPDNCRMSNRGLAGSGIFSNVPISARDQESKSFSGRLK